MNKADGIQGAAFWRMVKAGAAALLMLLIMPALPSGLQAQTDAETAEPGKMRLLRAMGEFPHRIGSMGGDSSGLDRPGRWAAVFFRLDEINGLPAGTCARDLPQVAEQMLRDRDKYPVYVHSVCFFITQTLARSRDLALQALAAAKNDEDQVAALIVAAAAEIELGNTETAIAHLDKALPKVQMEGRFEEWKNFHVLLIRAHEINNDLETVIELTQKVFDQHVKTQGADHDATLMWQNMLANHLYNGGRQDEGDALAAGLRKLITKKYGEDSDAMKQVDASLRLTRGIAQKKPDQDMTAIDADENKAMKLFSAHDFQEAAALFQAVYLRRKKLLGPEHPQTLDAQNNFGAVKHEIGSDQLAVEILEEVLKVREKVLPKDDPATLQTRNNLGNALRGLGEFKRSVEQHRHVLAARTKLFGPDDVRTLDAGNNLAGGLDDIGPGAEAETLARQVVAGRQKVQGKLHPATLLSRQVLASLMSINKKNEESKAEYRALLADCEKIFGPEHPSTIGVRTNLAEVLGKQGEFKEALAHGEKAYLHSLNTRGMNDKLTITCDRILREVKAGGDKASQNAREVMETSEKELGKGQSQVLNNQVALGNSLYAERRFKEAQKEFQAVISILEKQGLQDHLQGLHARNGLAEALRMQEKFKEAETEQRAVLAIATRKLGEDNDLRISSLSNLAQTLVGQSKFEEAQDLFMEAYTRRLEQLGENDRTVLQTCHRMAINLTQLNRLEEARKYGWLALDGFLRTTGADSKESAAARQLVGHLDYRIKSDGAGDEMGKARVLAEVVVPRASGFATRGGPMPTEPLPVLRS